MGTTTTVTWIRAGLVALPLYGALTLWSSLEPQPNPAEDYGAWARFVTTDEYVLTHVLGTGLGVILAIFGTFALGAHLSSTPTARLGLSAMVTAVFGQSIFLFFGGVSAFGSPMEGQAYLAGMSLDQLPDSPASNLQTIVLLTAIVLAFVGNVLLGFAIWRSGSLPRWAGILWIAAALLMYPFGIVLGALTTGATPPTVPIGAGIIIVAGGWMSWHTRNQAEGQKVRGPQLSAR